MTLHICLDPGHQGQPDLRPEPIWPGSDEQKARCAPGTRGLLTGTPEHVVVLDVALALADALRVEGATVTMTRDRDDVSLSNIERAEIAASAGATLTVRIHCDGVHPRLRALGIFRRGCSTLVPSDDHLDPELVRHSARWGEIAHPALVASTGFPDRGIHVRADLAGFNWSMTPVVLLELGFLTHPVEERALLSGELRQRVAQGLAVALVRAPMAS